MTSTEVWRERNRLFSDKIRKVGELTREYMETVYYPALKKLQEECGRIGHVRGQFADNGFGCSWFYCNQCGIRMDIQKED
jgi:hypothetical protein